MTHPGKDKTDNDSHDVDEQPADTLQQPDRPREVGGREGPDPTRYGDWEKNGRCIDF